jgi:hypothetical protein
VAVRTQVSATMSVEDAATHELQDSFPITLCWDRSSGCMHDRGILWPSEVHWYYLLMKHLNDFSHDRVRDHWGGPFNPDEVMCRGDFEEFD